jgi:dUTP pyrophosphatase
MIFDNFYFNVELLSENAKMPTRANEGDAGLDFYTPINIVINPISDCLIPLDIKVEFPKGFVLVIKEKSGIATKKKLSIGAAVIDCFYRGNCHIHLFNHSNDYVSFAKGDKIAQGIVIPIWDGQPNQVDFISIDTERSIGGFGSSGK